MNLITLIVNEQVKMGEWVCYHPDGQVTIQDKPSINTRVFSLCYDFLHNEDDLHEKAMECYKKYISIFNRYRPHTDGVVLADRNILAV